MNGKPLMPVPYRSLSQPAKAHLLAFVGVAGFVLELGAAAQGREEKHIRLFNHLMGGIRSFTNIICIPSVSTHLGTSCVDAEPLFGLFINARRWSSRRWRPLRHAYQRGMEEKEPVHLPSIISKNEWRKYFSIHHPGSSQSILSLPSFQLPRNPSLSILFCGAP